MDLFHLITARKPNKINPMRILVCEFKVYKPPEGVRKFVYS
jgi:hypothetical protein